jgi:hypothetical protein
VAECVPSNPVVLAGCRPPFLVYREPLAVRSQAILPAPNADTSPARGTFHKAASSRTDIVLLSWSRVVVTPGDRAGEDQF